MRVRLGHPKIFERLAAIAEATGRGERFPRAFHKELGITWPAVKRQFVQFMRKTEGDPTERFRSMIWAK
jgi:hypothetical protein